MRPAHFLSNTLLCERHSRCHSASRRGAGLSLKGRLLSVFAWFASGGALGREAALSLSPWTRVSYGHEFLDRRVSCACWTALGRPGVRHCRAHRQEWLLRVRFLQNEAKLSVASLFRCFVTGAPNLLERSFRCEGGIRRAESECKQSENHFRSARAPPSYAPYQSGRYSCNRLKSKGSQLWRASVLRRHPFICTDICNGERPFMGKLRTDIKITPT